MTTPTKKGQYYTHKDFGGRYFVLGFFGVRGAGTHDTLDLYKEAAKKITSIIGGEESQTWVRNNLWGMSKLEDCTLCD